MSLPRDLVRMTVQCGRPGTDMPYQDAAAYKDLRCYGQTANGKKYVAVQVGGGPLYSGARFRLPALGRDPVAMQYVQRSYGIVVFGL